MAPKTFQSRASNRIWKNFLAVCCAVLLVPGEGLILLQASAQTPPATPAPASTAEQPAAKIPPEQLESLVAPIALYPDELLAQVLVASTYPLELIQLQQWLAKHPDLKDKALADSVARQPWDPSIQSMAAVPEAVKRLAEDIQWTTDLGNAFLAQQSDVMDAVQRMRKKAKDKGALESNEQQKVETKVVEQKTVIIVEPTNPEVIYVPSYSPTVVYGAPLYYPYPPIYYPPYPAGAAFVSFGFGVAMGAAFWGGSCCGCGWGGNNVNINVHNNYNQINHNNNRPGGSGGGNWNHNPSHRGGTPYGDKGTANKYGGASAGNRQASAGASNRAGGGAGASAGASNRAGGGAGASAGASNRGGGGAGASAGASNRGGGSQASRNVPSNSGSKPSGGFSGGSGGYSGSSARTNSSRGSSSMGSRGGGGGSRGGGGRR